MGYQPGSKIIAHADGAGVIGSTRFEKSLNVLKPGGKLISISNLVGAALAISGALIIIGFAARVR